MAPEMSALHAACNQRYEASRRTIARARLLGVAVLIAAIVLVEIRLGFLRPEVTFTFGAVLGAVVYAASVRGLDAWRGARLGVIAGVLPLVSALVAESVGLVCTPAGCSSLCVPVCAASGALAALWIARVGRKRGARAEFFAAAGVAATAVGALGCACVSYTGASVLALAMVLTMGTSALLSPRATA